MPISKETKAPEREQKAKTPRKYHQFKSGAKQFQLTDIRDFKGTNYNTKEPEDQLLFQFNCVQKGVDRGKGIVVITNLKFSPPRDGKSPSKLYSITTAALGVDELTEAQIKDYQNNLWKINELISKQLIIVVKLVDGRSRADSFIVADDELEPLTELELLDPQNAEDNPLVLCSAKGCENVVRGWRKDDGSWCSQEDVLEYQHNKGVPENEQYCSKANHYQAWKAANGKS